MISILETIFFKIGLPVGLVIGSVLTLMICHKLKGGKKMGKHIIEQILEEYEQKEDDVKVFKGKDAVGFFKTLSKTRVMIIPDELFSYLSSGTRYKISFKEVD